MRDFNNNKTYVGVVLIHNYIDNLGSDAYAGEKSDLVDVCFDTLKVWEGRIRKSRLFGP